MLTQTNLTSSNWAQKKCDDTKWSPTACSNELYSGGLSRLLLFVWILIKILAGKCTWCYLMCIDNFQFGIGLLNEYDAIYLIQLSPLIKSETLLSFYDVKKYSTKSSIPLYLIRSSAGKVRHIKHYIVIKAGVTNAFHKIHKTLYRGKG